MCDKLCALQFDTQLIMQQKQHSVYVPLKTTVAPQLQENAEIFLLGIFYAYILYVHMDESLVKSDSRFRNDTVKATLWLAPNSLERTASFLENPSRPVYLNCF